MSNPVKPHCNFPILAPVVTMACILSFQGCERLDSEKLNGAPEAESSSDEPSTELILASDFQNNPNNTGNIHVMKIDGSGKCELTTGSNVNTLASWSHDGNKIVFLSNAGGSGDIWIMDANGDNKRQLTFSGAITSAFSPDGRSIVYSGTSTGDPEIWVMDSDGSNQRRLTTTTIKSPTRTHGDILWSIHPSYSPDGKKIVYASTQSGQSQIWVMNADGTSQTQLTFPGYPDAPDANAPAWSPDGKKIVFWSGYETEYGSTERSG
jgi:Tol biopolymer transport system component